MLHMECSIFSAPRGWSVIANCGVEIKICGLLLPSDWQSRSDNANRRVTVETRTPAAYAQKKVGLARVTSGS